MNDFLGEEAMFDEQDRRLRLRVNSNQAIEVDATPATRGAPPLSPVTDSGPAPPPTVVEPIPSTPGGDTTTPAPAPHASDNRPRVDAVRAQQLAAGDFEDLGSMEAEAKRLESLARELDSRASALEHRVHELE